MGENCADFTNTADVAQGLTATLTGKRALGRTLSKNVVIRVTKWDVLQRG